MPGQHSLLSPSASHRWLACPPSGRLHARLTERLGDQSSEFAAEGTKAHAVAELKLRLANGEINQFRHDAERKLLGEIPKDMDMFTDVYVDTVLEKLYDARKLCPDARLFIEQKLDMTKWVPACYGTSDAVIVSDNTLEVLDLKFGKGVPVSAVGNPQARLYALGAINEFEARRSIPSTWSARRSSNPDWTASRRRLCRKLTCSLGARPSSPPPNWHTKAKVSSTPAIGVGSAQRKRSAEPEQRKR